MISGGYKMKSCVLFLPRRWKWLYAFRGCTHHPTKPTPS